MKLFNYRREKLRASILLDGYHLLSRASAGAESQPRGNDIFQDKLAAASLQALVDLQREFKVSDEEELVTLHSYAGLLRTMNDRRAYAIQDQAMGVAWRMRDKALEEQFLELMFDCQIGWIETRVKNGRPVMAESEQEEAASAALPDIDAAIDFIKKHQSLKNYPGLLARFQRAELFHNLSLANLDVSRDLIAELKAPGSPWDDDALLIPSLKMLLAIQTGDFATAFEIKKTSLMDVLSQPQGQKHMIPLYALAELENATHFSTIDAILELHNLLQAPLAANSPEPSPLLHTLRRENALQLALAMSHTEKLRVDKPTDRQKLTAAIQRLVSTFSLDGDSAAYLRVLRYFAEEDTENPHSTLHRTRARIALAGDVLQRFKDLRAQETQAIQAARKADVSQKQDAFKQSNNEIANLRRKMSKIAASASDLLEQPDSQPAQFEALNALYNDTNKQLARAQEQLDRQKASLLKAYDELFRIPGETGPASQGASDQLKLGTVERELAGCVVPLVHYLRSVESSDAASGLLYNARCLVLETATLLQPAQLGCTPDECDRLASSIVDGALRLRKNWSGWQRDIETTTQSQISEARNRLFDRYQLGFELAVRWAVFRGDFASALQTSARTTNRSLSEFLNNDEGDQLGLPDNLISYYSGNESLQVFWRVNNGPVQHAESLVNRASLNNTVQSLLEKYRSRQSHGYELEEQLLAGWLLPNKLCEALLTLSPSGSQCVYIAPHGPLFQLPLDGLPVLGAGNQSLGDLQPLIYLPSLMKRARHVPQVELPADRARFLTIQPNWTVGAESEYLVKTLGPGKTIRLGPDQCEAANILEQLNQPWEIIHFAAHAQASVNGSADPSTALSQPAASTQPHSKRFTNQAIIAIKDGFLSTEKLKTCSLRARHVFLSACETQVTDISDLQSGGNTLKTLGTTFLAIGAEDVIASHWRVSNDSTTELFKALIREYSQMSPSRPPTTEELAEQFFKARKHMRGEFSHPFDWNAFTLWTLP